MDNLLLDPFLRLLEEISPVQAVRNAEKSGASSGLISALQESGFLDACLAEEAGGAGLYLNQIADLAVAAGKQLLPFPFAETTMARGVLGDFDCEDVKTRPILFWPMADGDLQSLAAPLFANDGLALVQHGEALTLRETRPAEPDGFGFLPATIDVSGEPLLAFSAADLDVLALAATATAANMVGAMGRVLQLCLDYTNQRQQFGRPLAKFQVIQHQLAVMAEKIAISDMAVRIAFDIPIASPDRWKAGVAKCLSNEAASLVCSSAHAVFGAIGISEEHDLQLYIRRIKRWQLSFGSESFWAEILAGPRLDFTGNSIDFVRGRLASN